MTVSLEDQLQQNYIKGFTLCEEFPDFQVYRESDNIHFITPCTASWMQGVLTSNIDSQILEKRCSSLLEIYRTSNIPALWRIGSLTKERALLEKVLEKLGCKETEGGNTMILNGPPSAKKNPLSELRIERVLTPDGLIPWTKPFAEAFEVNDFDTAFLKRCLLHTLHPDSSFQHFVGYDEQNNPVSCSSILLHENTAVLYNVATSSKFRGKGYATTLVNHAIEFSNKNWGEKIIGLFSSKMGENIYKKMGFTSIGTLSCWEI